MSEKTCFVGCSYTFGSGFENENFDPDLWTVLLHKALPELSDTEYVNLGIPGGSNEKIFTAATEAIVTLNPKIILVQWTTYPRFNFLLGIETYPTSQTFAWESKVRDHNLHDISYSAKYLENTADRFLALEHPHNQIESIVKYCNILIKLADHYDCKIFFVNGGCSWDENYFVKLDNVLPSQYTILTQKFLNTQTRDDNEVFILYNRIHNDYQKHGGIQDYYWLNLYTSFRKIQIDSNQDGRHPGKQTNQLIFNLLSQSLKEKLGS